MHFGNQKCALKNIKSALFLFERPALFFRLRGNSACITDDYSDTG